MAVITIFSASYSNGQEVAAGVADRLGFTRVDDETLISVASEQFKTPPDKLRSALFGAPGFFNRLTRAKEKYAALLRLAVIDVIESDNVVYHGFGGLLLPDTLSHVLRGCLAATHGYRVEQGKSQGHSTRDAESRIEKDDVACAEWTKFLFDLGPWDKSLYDCFLPMQSTTVDEAVDALSEYALRPATETKDDARKALDDCRLAARVNMALVERGHDTDVSSKDGDVTILIRRHAMRLKRLQSELAAIAEEVSGVRRATARPGPRCQEPSVYAPLDVDVPSKILLVDDEKEFVHTLSERLQARSMSPAVAYDGEEALTVIEADQPDVMVLDLKMPGIDGLEVLRRVKQKHPETEVIILTGHGSEAEETLAEQLGAFAYLRKPVDIDILTDTMKKAYAKVNAGKNSPEDVDRDVG